MRGWRAIDGAAILGPALFAAALAAASLVPASRLLVAEMAIAGLFALSLSLVLSVAGIVSLGHAAFFGTGAYAAGLFAIHAGPDPLAGLAVATSSSRHGSRSNGGKGLPSTTMNGLVQSRCRHSARRGAGILSFWLRAS